MSLPVRQLLDSISLSLHNYTATQPQVNHNDCNKIHTRVRHTKLKLRFHFVYLQLQKRYGVSDRQILLYICTAPGSSVPAGTALPGHDYL